MNIDRKRIVYLLLISFSPKTGEQHRQDHKKNKQHQSNQLNTYTHCIFRCPYN